MIMVTFQGVAYLFVGESLDESGALATPDAYRTGRASFACYFPDGDGRIMRYGATIGTRADLAVIGPAVDMTLTPDEVAAAFGNLMSDEGWEKPS